MNNIKIKLGKRDNVTPDFLDKIKPFQLDGKESPFKITTEKDIADLAGIIRAIGGYIEPIRLWNRGKKGIYCIDGDKKIQATKLLISQGEPVPKIPIEWLEIDSEETAWQLVLAYSSTYGQHNKEFDYKSIPVKAEYIQVIRMSNPKKIRMVKKERKPREYPFKQFDRITLGENIINVKPFDFSKKLEYNLSEGETEKMIKKYVEDCKYKNKQPVITINGVNMEIK